MNRIWIKTMATMVAAAAALGTAAGIAAAGIEGSKHDFTSSEWSADDTCGACHTPHRAAPPKAAPLWNPQADLSRRFGSALGDTSKPGSGTTMCMRCHDGTIATETITGVVANRFANKQNPSMFNTGHGTSDHPVGVKYPSVDRGFRPLTSVVASGEVRLPGGRVECTSCHDPHNQAGVAHMLVKSNARSALCLTCHKK